MHWIPPELAAEFAASSTDAYRIADGEGCRVERFGDGVIISKRTEALPHGLLGEIADWCAQAGVRIERFYERRLVVAPSERDAPRAIGRTAQQHTCIVREEALCYQIDFLAGYSCGLFLDQRGNRRRLRTANASRLLNLFAYTCSFSVAAAVSGARTLSIDLSKVALERGRRNFALNSLSLEGHRFIPDDVFRVLPRLARRREKFEAIMLDPPTFSRGRDGRVFRAERDYGRLIELALACAAPGALLLLATNCSKLGESELRTLGRQHARAPVTFFSSPGLPDIQYGSATVWMQIEKA